MHAFFRSSKSLLSEIKRGYKHFFWGGSKWGTFFQKLILGEDFFLDQKGVKLLLSGGQNGGHKTFFWGDEFFLLIKKLLFKASKNLLSDSL